MLNNIIINVRELNLWYGESQALRSITMPVADRKVTSLIGPSGCGKSTLIRCFNRMNDLVPGCRMEGSITFHDREINDPEADAVDIRMQIGMVFQKPNPFPKSIYENIAYGPRVHGTKDRAELDRIVENSLKKAALWEEVKNRLHESALGLSGGQQQRLCIARTLAVNPEIILMDEPCSALDPIATSKIEDLIEILKQEFCVVIVTHSMSQAARVSDYTAFMYLGDLIEFGETRQIFENPKKELTENYITGRFG